MNLWEHFMGNHCKTRTIYFGIFLNILYPCKKTTSYLTLQISGSQNLVQNLLVSYTFSHGFMGDIGIPPDKNPQTFWTIFHSLCQPQKFNEWIATSDSLQEVSICQISTTRWFQIFPCSSRVVDQTK